MIVFFITIGLLWISRNLLFLVIYLEESKTHAPFTPSLFYHGWKINWFGAWIFCILAYIIFPIWGIWSLFNIGRKRDE